MPKPDNRRPAIQGGKIRKAVEVDLTAVPAEENYLELAEVCQGIYIGTGGNLTVTLEQDDTEVTFVGASAGVTHPIKAKRIHTSTTASDIIAVY